MHCRRHSKETFPLGVLAGLILYAYGTNAPSWAASPAGRRSPCARDLASKAYTTEKEGGRKGCIDGVRRRPPDPASRNT